MNKLSGILLVSSLLYLGAAGLHAASPNGSFKVIPLPSMISEKADAEGFALYSNVKISAPDSLSSEADMLRGYLKENPNIPTGNAPGEIALRCTLSSDSPEAYCISVRPGLLIIDGASPAGVFYGIQTIRKAAYTAPKGESPVLPSATIADAPRFSYRGAMLDVARHPFTEENVKSFIDMMALHNLNTFHWHITDDQGWRMEIEKYPLLTAVGSRRDSTVIGHNSGVYDNKPVGGYFTKEQARDIVEYAARRHITVIPEIDLPGHMLAALTAYPSLGCTGGPYGVWGRWGVSPDVLCAGNDSTLTFIDDVLNEVMDIFPSKYVHIGGDECPKTRWKECPKCQKRISELGIKPEGRFSAEDKLQGVITTHALQTLAARGRHAIGWDEILEGDIPQDAIIMSWRGVDGAIEGTGKGHHVVLSPASYCYLDYYQSPDQALEPMAWGGYVPVSRTYRLDPTEGMTPEQSKLVLGPQVNLWTEYIDNYPKVEYMELPRMSALAEVGWTPQSMRDYKDFSERMPALWRLYNARDYNYARHMADVDARLTTVHDARKVIAELSSIGTASIYYTTDGSEPIGSDGQPSPTALPYSKPISLDKSTMLKSSAIFEGKAGRTRSDSVTFNPATFGKVELSHPFEKHHAPAGEATLTDAQTGGPSFQTGHWVGFGNCNPTVTVTLPEPTTISEVTFNTCVDMNAWIADASAYSIEVLTCGPDGEPKWIETASESLPERRADQPDNEVESHTSQFSPVKAEKVRINLKASPLLPVWHRDHSETARPLLFIDEIGVR